MGLRLKFARCLHTHAYIYLYRILKHFIAYWNQRFFFVCQIDQNVNFCTYLSISGMEISNQFFKIDLERIAKIKISGKQLKALMFKCSLNAYKLSSAKEKKNIL